MCGIAGMVDLAGQRAVPNGVLQAMAKALVHRGPDEEGFLTAPGVGLVSRRLSIVGLFDGRQPIRNEAGDVAVVYNGELFDYPEKKAELEAHGHRFATHCDTEILPHLWEDHQEGMLEQLRGQFALALWDQRQRRLVLARDRFGICPLYWARAGDWLMFASEIKAILASGLVAPRPNLRGLNHVFTFMALPGTVTCFEGINLLLPGRYLRVDLPGPGTNGRLQERVFWEMDFPDHGEEERSDAKRLVGEFERLMLQATARRLRADVPVVSYLSGGVDSSTVVALASKVLGRPVPTFTIQITEPSLDETSEAGLVARHLGAEPVIVPCGPEEVRADYAQLVRAAEGPVIDTSCTALLALAREVHTRGYKVALTGEGADEWLAGYPWFKVHKLLSFLDVVPGFDLGLRVRRTYLKLIGSPRPTFEQARRAAASVGGPNAWLNFYGLISLSKLHFYSREMFDRLADHNPYEDLGLNHERLRRWHPFNRGLYLGGRIHLAGHLLSSKGDRVAMNSSVETRYPFLDEDVFSFLARQHPRWKLRGLQDKYLLRLLAERWLPKEIAWRKKAMFRAPFDSFHARQAPAFVGQLLSEEALRKTGYFDPAAVRYWGTAYRQLRPGSKHRLAVEMGLVGVVATQLWHQTFIDSGLAEVPATSRPMTLGFQPCPD